MDDQKRSGILAQKSISGINGLPLAYTTSGESGISLRNHRKRSIIDTSSFVSMEHEVFQNSLLPLRPKIVISDSDTSNVQSPDEINREPINARLSYTSAMLFSKSPLPSFMESCMQPFPQFVTTSSLIHSNNLLRIPDIKHTKSFSVNGDLCKMSNSMSYLRPDVYIKKFSLGSTFTVSILDETFSPDRRKSVIPKTYQTVRSCSYSLRAFFIYANVSFHEIRMQVYAR